MPLSEAESRRLRGRRLRGLKLTGPRTRDPAEVVRWLGAVQSQDYGPAKWSVAQRMGKTTDAAIERAVSAGRLLRTHVLRPTWHFVHQDDIRMLLAVTGPRIQMANAGRYRDLRMSQADRDRADRIIAKAVEGENHQTRPQLAKVLESRGLSTKGQRLAYFLMHAELTGTVCSGSRDGSRHTYALLDERAGQARDMDQTEAAAALAVRYFTSHGPATVKDLQAWASLTQQQVNDALERSEGRVHSEKIDGKVHWSARKGPTRLPDPPQALLLQAYDEYIMGYRDTRSFHFAKRVPTRPTENAFVAVNGEVVGYWGRTIRNETVEIRVVGPRRLEPDEEDSISDEADRFGRFLGLRPELTLRRFR